MKTYEKELPNNYTLVKTIDATNKKVGLIFNLIALGVLALTMVGAFLIVRVDFKEVFGISGLIRLMVFVVILLAYTVLHELVHGLAYKLLTKQKLKFGLTLSVAFCGVPQIYVYRTTALIAVLAPFALFLPVLTIVPFFLPKAVDKILLSILWGLHVGGCVGDLYVSGLLLFKYRDKRVLMNDTGPKQTFYIPSEEPLTERGNGVAVPAPAWEVERQEMTEKPKGAPRPQGLQNSCPQNKKKKRHKK